MSKLVKLKAATRLRDIANLLQINPSHLSYILFKAPQEKKYETFEVPKRNGQKRIINAPVGPSSLRSDSSRRSFRTVSMRLTTQLAAKTECRTVLSVVNQ